MNTQRTHLQTIQEDMQTIQENAHAQNAACPWARQCGGCSLIGDAYEKQLQAKDAQVGFLLADTFSKKQLSGVKVHPVHGMDNPFFYRDKIASPFAPVRGKSFRRDNRGQNMGAKKKSQKNHHARSRAEASVACGLYARGTHTIVPVTRCVVEAPVGRRIILAIRRLMLKFDVPAYDEDRKTGFIRHAIVRVGHQSGEVLVTIVTAQEEWPHGKQFAKQLVKAVPQITTVVQNVNSRVTNAMLGQKEHVLYGPGFILDRVCGVTFRISSKTFFQVNSTQTEVLYDTAIQMAHLDELSADVHRPLHVLDAYCGSGAIGLIAAHRYPSTQIVGVESVASAVADAKQNAVHNGISNARFIKADATKWILDRVDTLEESADVVFMDPPRAGSTPAFLHALIKAAPQRIVYVSCKPITQMRDLTQLVGHGYVLDEVQPVDMFPQTPHVETVCLLNREDVV